MPATHKPAAGIPLSASCHLDPQRLERMWRLTPDQRQAAFRRGEFSLAEMSRAAARFPSEFEIVDGEYWYLTRLLADVAG